MFFAPSIISIRCTIISLCFSSLFSCAQSAPLQSRSTANASVAQSSDVSSLVKALKDDNPEVRIDVIQALGEIRPGGKVATAQLIVALTDHDSRIRAAAAYSLGSLGAKEAVPQLIGLLKDDDKDVRFSAVYALEQLGPMPTQAVPQLIEALKGEDDHIRGGVASLLGSIGPAANAAVPQLILAMDDKNDYVRSNVLGALASIGPAAKAAVPKLALALNDSDPSVRLNVANVLRSIGPAAKDATPQLIAALQDPVESARNSNVANALARIGPPAVPFLIPMLMSRDEGISFRAGEVLMQIGPGAKDAVPQLIVALKDANNNVLRYRAASVLGSIGPEAKDAVPQLIVTLTDADVNVRLNSISALGMIGAASKDAIPQLILTLNDHEENNRLNAARVLGSIADAVNLNSDEAAIPSLERALEALKRADSPGAAEATNKVGRSLDSLRFKQVHSLKQRVLATVGDKRIATALAILILYTVWFILLRFIILSRWPLKILFLNQVLLPYSKVKMPKWLGEIEIPASHLFLVGFFNYHPRVLDAWVEKYIETARQSLQERASYNSRRIYVPLPLKVGGQTVITLKAEGLHPSSEQTRWCMRIVGDGGVGKTTLAYQLALWAMEREPAKRLCQDHRMLPVVIEPGSPFATDRGTKVDAEPDLATFKQALRGALQDSIKVGEPIPDTFFEQLLRTRRIVVILDGLSEMQAGSDKAKGAGPTHPDFPANALIMTSRTTDLLSYAVHTDLQPLLIDSNHLATFMNAYLSEAHLTMEDSQLFQACGRLAEMASENRGITPLLARLFAEELVGTLKHSNPLNGLPRTIPDLMLSYLNHLNRNRAAADPDNPTVHRAVKLAAWCCMKGTFRPGQEATKKEVESSLDRASIQRTLITYLDAHLALVRTVPPGETTIRFELDPLEEYLAALHVLELIGDNKGKWEEFLDRADNMPGAPNTTRGFLLAMHDCCEAKGSEFNVPSFLLRELRERTGLNTREQRSIA